MCRVELFGVARVMAGVRDVTLDSDVTMTVGELLPALASQCPALVGPVLDAERGGLLAGYVLNRDGREFLLDMDAKVAPNDCVLLLSSAAGG